MQSNGYRERSAPHRTILGRKSPDSFGVYHDLVGASGAEVSRLGDAFEATVIAYHSGRLTLFNRQLVGAEHLRDSTQIRRDDFDHYYLQVLRSGRIASGRSGDERRLAPGDAVLFDATQPMRTRVEDADYVTVILARDLVEAAAPNARRLHGHILSRNLPNSIGKAVLSIARRAASFSSDLEIGSSQLLAGLLGQIEGDRVDIHDGCSGETELEASRRLRAELFIDDNLGLNLDVDLIARRTGVSRSSLYRAFRAVGGIEMTIAKRRAARLKSLMLRPDEGRQISSLAFTLGFSNISHCSRVFKEIYGQTPSQLRAIGRDAAGSISHTLQVDRMREWYNVMNRGPRGG
ncbi:helix-turn-helix domain-containing protein [Methylobacterium sp. NMS12]|uniref:helix-turn-helix domain-containing protein n=1 Tax=Methylobacterium sp. NMS12 TaxID=3079766 RepID=UPI003F883B33